jgi:hypothetical protein
VAKSKKEKEMRKNLGKYMRKKMLEVNVEEDENGGRVKRMSGTGKEGK